MESYLGNHRPYYPQGLPTTSGESSTATTYSTSPSPSHYPLYHGVNPHHTQPSPSTPNHSAAIPVMRKAPHQYSGELQYSQHTPRQFSSPPGSSQLPRPISDPYLMRHNSLQHAAPYIPPHSRPPDVQGSVSRNSGTRSLEVTRVGPAHTFSSISPVESGQIITSRPNIAHASVTNSHTMDYRLSDSRYLDQHRSSSYGVSSSSRSSASSLGRGHSSKSGNQHPPTLIKAEEPTTLSAAHLQLQRSIQQPHTKEKRFETATAPVPYSVAKRAEDPYYNDKLEESYACIKKVENPYAINNLTASGSRSSGEVEIKRQKNEAYSGIRNQQLINAYMNDYSQLNGTRESWTPNAGGPQTSCKVEKYRENKSDLVLDLSVKTVRQTADSTAPEPEVMSSTSGTPSLPNMYGTSAKSSPYNCNASAANEEITGSHKVDSNKTDFHRYSDVNCTAPNFGKLFSQEPNGMPSVSRYSPNISSKRPSDSPLNQVNKMSKLDSTFAQQQYLDSRCDKPYPPSVRAETGSLQFPGINDKAAHDPRMSYDPCKSWNSGLDNAKPSFAHSSYIKQSNCQTTADGVPEISPAVTSDSKFYQPDVRGLHQNLNHDAHNASNYIHSSHYYNYPDKYPGIQPPYTVSSVKEKYPSHSYYNSYESFGPGNLSKNTSALELSKPSKGEMSQPLEHHREIRVKTELEINNSCLPQSGYPNPSSSSNSVQSSSKYNSLASIAGSFQYFDTSSNNAQSLVSNDQNRPLLQDSANKHNIPNAIDRNVYKDSLASDFYSNQCSEGSYSVPTRNLEVPMGQHTMNMREQYKTDAVPYSHSSYTDFSIDPCGSSNSVLPVNNISNKHIPSYSKDVPNTKIVEETISVKEIPDSSESNKNLEPSLDTNEKTSKQSPNLSIITNVQPDPNEKSISSFPTDPECEASRLDYRDCTVDAEPKTKITIKDSNTTISKPFTLTETEESKVVTKESLDPSKSDKKFQIEKTSSKRDDSLSQSTKTADGNASDIASSNRADCSNGSNLCLIKSKELNTTSEDVISTNTSLVITDCKETLVKVEEILKVPTMAEQNITTVDPSSEIQNNGTKTSSKNDFEEVPRACSGVVSKSPNQLINEKADSKSVPDSNVEGTKTFSSISERDFEGKPEKQLEGKVVNLSEVKVYEKSSCKEENQESALNTVSDSEKKDNEISKSKVLIEENKVTIPDVGIDCPTLPQSKLQLSDSLSKIQSVVSKPKDNEVEKSETLSENSSDCKNTKICDNLTGNDNGKSCKILSVDKMIPEIKVVDPIITSCNDSKINNINTKKENLVSNQIETSETNTDKHTIVENLPADMPVKAAQVLLNKTNDLEVIKAKKINGDVVNKDCKEEVLSDNEVIKQLKGEAHVEETKEDHVRLEKKDNAVLNNESFIDNLKQVELCVEVKKVEKHIGEINEASDDTLEQNADNLVHKESEIKLEIETNVASRNGNNEMEGNSAGKTVDNPVKEEKEVARQESKQGDILKDDKSESKCDNYNYGGKILQSEKLILHENNETGCNRVFDGISGSRDKDNVQFESKRSDINKLQKDTGQFESKETDVKELQFKHDDIQKYTTNIIKQRLLGPCGTDREVDSSIASKSTIDHNTKCTTLNNGNKYNEEASNPSLLNCNSSYNKVEGVSSKYSLNSETRNAEHMSFDTGNDKVKDLSLDPTKNSVAVQKGDLIDFSKHTPLSRNIHELEPLKLSKSNGSSRPNNSFQSPWEPVMPYSIPTKNPMSLPHKVNTSSVIESYQIDRSIHEKKQNIKNIQPFDNNLKQVNLTKDHLAKSHLPPPHSHLDPYLASRSPFAARPHPAHSVPVLTGPLNPPPSHSAPPHSAHSGKTVSQQSAAIMTAHSSYSSSSIHTPYYHPLDRQEYRPPPHAFQPTTVSSVVSTTYNPSLTISTVPSSDHYEALVPSRSVRSPHSPTHPPPPVTCNSHLYSQRAYSQSYQGAMTDPSPYNYLAPKPTYTQGNSYVTPSYSASSMGKTQPNYHDIQASQGSHESNLSAKHAYQYPNYQTSYSNQLQNPYHPSYKYPTYQPPKENSPYPPVSKGEPYPQSITSHKSKSLSTPPVSYPNTYPQQPPYSTSGSNSYPLNNYVNSHNLTTQTSNVNKSSSLCYPSVSQPIINPHVSAASQHVLSQHHMTTSRSQPASISPYSTNLLQSHDHPHAQLHRQTEPELSTYPQTKSNTTPTNFCNTSLACSQASRYETKPNLITQTSPSPYSQNYSHMSAQPTVQGYHSSVTSHSYYQPSQQQTTQSYASIQSPHPSQSTAISGYPTKPRTIMSPRGSRASTPHSNSQSPRNLSPHPSRHPSPSKREYQSVPSYSNSTTKEPRTSSNHTPNQSTLIAKDQMQPANLSYKAPVVNDNLNPQIYGNPTVVELNSLTRSSPIQQPPLNLSSNSTQLEANTSQRKSVQSPFHMPSQPCLPSKVPVSHVQSGVSYKSSHSYTNSYFPPNAVSESPDVSIPHAHGRGKTDISKLDNYKLYQQGENVVKQSPYNNNQLQQSYKDFPPKHDVSPYQNPSAIPYTKVPVSSHSEQSPIPPQENVNNALAHHYPTQPRYPAPNAHYHYGSNQHLNKVSPPSNPYHHQTNASLYGNSPASKPGTQPNYQYSPPTSHSSTQYTSPMTKPTSSSPWPYQCSKPLTTNIRQPTPHSGAMPSIPVSNYSNSQFNANSSQQSNKIASAVLSNYEEPYPNYQSQHPLPSHQNSQKLSIHASAANLYPILPAHANVSKASQSASTNSFPSPGPVPYNSPYSHSISSTSKPTPTLQYSNSVNHFNRSPFHPNESAAHMHHQTSFSRQSGSPYNKDMGIRYTSPNTILSSQTGVPLHTQEDKAQYPCPKPAHSNTSLSQCNSSYHDKPGHKTFTELTSMKSLKPYSPSLSISKDLYKGDDRQLHTQSKSSFVSKGSDNALSVMTTETKMDKISSKPAEPGKAALVEKLQKKLIKRDSYDSETVNDESIEIENKHIGDMDLKFAKLIEDLETNKDTVTSKRSCVVTKRYIQKVQLQNAADNNEELIPIPYTEDENTESEREEPIKKFRGKFRSIKEKAVERVILTYASHSDESATEMIPDDDASDFEEELIKEIEAKARKGRSKLKGGRLRELKGGRLREVRKKYSSDESSTQPKRKIDKETKTRRLTRKREREFCSSSTEDLSSSSDSRESSSSDDSNSDSSLDSASASEDESLKRNNKTKLSRRQRTDDSDSESSNSDNKISSSRKTRKRHMSSSEEANYFPKRGKIKRRGKHHLKKNKTSSHVYSKGAKRKNSDYSEPFKRRILMRKQGDLESDSDEPRKEVTKNFKIVKRKRQVTSSESDDDDFDRTENVPKDYQIKDEFTSDNDSEVKFVLQSNEKTDGEEKEIPEGQNICIDKDFSNQQETESRVPDSVILKLNEERQGELNREDVMEMNLWKQKASLEMEKLLDDLPETRTRHMWKKPVFMEEFKKGWQEEIKKYKIDSARIPKKLISIPPLPSTVISQGQGIDKGYNQKKTKDGKKAGKSKEAGSPSPAKNTRSKSGIIKTSMAVAEKNHFKVASRPEMSNFMQNLFEKVLAGTVANESKKFQPFAPFTHTRIRTPTGLTPTPSVALSMMASDDSDRDSLASLRTDIPASDSVPVARRSSIANSLIKKLKKKYARKVDTQWLNKSRPLLEATNEPQLLPTPGLSALSSQLSTTPYDSFKMKTFFREYSFNKYRKNFDQVLSDGGINKLTPVLVPSRTRNKAKEILDAATLKSVFGEELCSVNTVKDDLKPKKKISPNLFKKKKDIITTTVRDSPIPSSLSLSSTPTEYLYNDDYDSELRSERSESTLRELAIMQDIKKSGRKLRKYRKFRSGFDYIRKKKKVKTEEESSVQTLKRKMPTRKKALWPEESRDVANEVRSWVVNKGLGETVLHKAARLEYHDVVIYCLESGDFNINTKDNAGYTPLHEACYRGHLEIAQAFCAHSAHVNASGYGGMRPLHEAIENGHIELARLLLSYGADPSLATYGGQTCLALASDSQAESFLHDYTADIKGKQAEKWFMSGPASIFDPENQGFNVFSNTPVDKMQESEDNYKVLSVDPSNDSNSKNLINSLLIKREKDDEDADKLSVARKDEIVFESSSQFLPNIYDISGRPDCYVLLCELLEILDLTKNELIMSAGGIETLHLSFEEFERNAKCNVIGYKMSVTRNLVDKIVMVKYTSQVKDLFDIEYTCV